MCSEFLKKFFWLVVVGNFLFVTGHVTAQSSCTLTAPKSCYKFREQMQTWQGGDYCGTHSPTSGDTINLATYPQRSEVCKALGKSAGCTTLSAGEVQNIVRDKFLYKNNLYKEETVWPSLKITKNHFLNYHPRASFKLSIPQPIWNTSKKEISCGYGTSLLTDKLYGWCTQYALQLYLNKDCLLPKQIVLGGTSDDDKYDQSPYNLGPYDPRPIISHDPDDIIDGYSNYGYTPDSTIKICREGGSTEADIRDIAIFFDANGDSGFREGGGVISYRGGTADVCTRIFGTSYCELEWLKTEVASQIGNRDPADYTDNAADFKTDLTTLLTVGCNPDKYYVIGTEEDEKIPVEEQSIPDANGSLQICDENSGKIRNAKLFFLGPEMDGDKNPDAVIGNPSLGIGTEVCAAFKLGNIILGQESCDLDNLAERLSKIMVYEGLPADEIEQIRNNPTLRWAKEAERFETYINGTDYEAFKKDLTHYLTVNCRTSDDAGYTPEVTAPELGDRTKHKVNHCPDAGVKPLEFYTYKNDTLLSSEFCSAYNKMADDYKDIEGFVKVPINPNGSCNVVDIQNGIFDMAWSDWSAELDKFNASSVYIPPSEWLFASAFAQDALAKPTPTGVFDDATFQAAKNYFQIKCPQCLDNPEHDTMDPTKIACPFLVGPPDPNRPPCCNLSLPYNLCLGVIKQRELGCKEDCIPGYEKNALGECMPQEFWDWTEDQLRPKYQVGANWDDRKYTGDASDLTYWFQRFGGKLTSFIALIAVVFITAQGVIIVLAAGSTDVITKAKKAITWTFIGLGLTVFAYILVKTIISLTYK